MTPASDLLLVGARPGATPISGLFQIIKFNSNGVPLWTNLNANFGSNSELHATTAKQQRLEQVRLVAAFSTSFPAFFLPQTE